jgi:hypothetical protein
MVLSEKDRPRRWPAPALSPTGCSGAALPLSPAGVLERQQRRPFRVRESGSAAGLFEHL